MASNRDYRPGDHFVVTFTTDQHIDGLWHHFGRYICLRDGRGAYDRLMRQDAAEAKARGESLVGCRWRMTRERGGEVMETVLDRRMTDGGIVDLVRLKVGEAT